jgi:hypothetical protein
MFGASLAGVPSEHKRMQTKVFRVDVFNLPEVRLTRDAADRADHASHSKR